MGYDDKRKSGKQLPVGGAEDVEYSEELADTDDREAQRRAAEADRRERGN